MMASTLGLLFSSSVSIIPTNSAKSGTHRLSAFWIAFERTDFKGEMACRIWVGVTVALPVALSTPRRRNSYESLKCLCDEKAQWR